LYETSPCNSKLSQQLVVARLRKLLNMFMERGSVMGAEIHVENYVKTGAGMWPVESSTISSMGERLRGMAFFSTRCTSKKVC
jgi:hypothetical protein